MTDHADIKHAADSSTDSAWKARLREEVAEREAMEWLERCMDAMVGERHARTIKTMLAARRFPARLSEEDAHAIAEAMKSSGWWMSGQFVQTVWEYAYAHLSDPPKPPTLEEEVRRYGT